MSLATNAALYRAVAKLLTSWGWPVEYAAGWETRTNGSAIRTPSAVTVHHTGGKATATSYLLNPRDRPQLGAMKAFELLWRGFWPLSLIHDSILPWPRYT